jgi:protein-S-isoprenylcysteine O-methyltransferase Ste14
MLRLGGLVLVAGMLVSVIAMLPLLTDLELPSLFWWLAMLLVATGLGLVILGLLRNGRQRSRLQRTATTPHDG